MKKNTNIVKVLIMLLMAIVLVSCGIDGETEKEKVKIPNTNKEFKKMKVSKVVDILEESGFTNIITEADNNLVLGLIRHSGDVIKVTINGSKDYNKDDEYDCDVKVVVTFFSNGEDEEINTISEKEVDTGTTEEATSEKSLETTTVQESSEIEITTYETVAETEEESTEEVETEIETEKETETEKESETKKKKKKKTIKISNDQGFKKFMDTKYPDEDTIRDFTEEYGGKTVVFNAFVGYTEDGFPHILIYRGDSPEGYEDSFDPGNYSGPSIQLQNITQNVYIGENVKVKAKVLDYKEGSNMLYLKCINIKER